MEQDDDDNQRTPPPPPIEEEEGPQDNKDIRLLHSKMHEDIRLLHSKMHEKGIPREVEVWHEDIDRLEVSNRSQPIGLANINYENSGMHFT